MSVVQVLVVSGTLFVLYKFLLGTIGVRQLGIWSLVMATGSLTQLSNLGMTGGVTKFVASYAAREEHELASQVVQTAVLSLSFSTGIVLALLLLFARPLLSLFVPADSLATALSIVPHALLSLWIMIIPGVFQAGLDGYHRIDSRNVVVILGSLLYLGVCCLFTLKWGLRGLAAASVFQNLWLLLVTRRVLKKHIPSLPIFRYRWNFPLFKEMLAYGVRFQAISASIMATDPVTKIFLSKFGGLAAVGYYDMCNRMVQQLRGLIVVPGYSLVPAAADLKERNAERIAPLYFSSYDLTFCIATGAYGLLVMCAPLISRLWIGHHEPVFVAFTVILSLGWFFNILSAPVYFINLGTGDLKWNLVGHVATAVINGACGFLAGRYFGGLGVAVAWAVALTACSAIINWSYYRDHGIPLSRLMPRSSMPLFAVCVAGVGLTYLSTPWLGESQGVRFTGHALFACAILALLWVHPSRKQLFGLVMRKGGMTGPKPTGAAGR